MTTPDQWRRVRIVPGTKHGLYSIVHFFSHLPIRAGAKDLLKLDLDTDDLVEESAVYIGQKFEDGFRRLDEALAANIKSERATKRQKMA